MGIHSIGEQIRINFGRNPFVFDVAGYVAALRSGEDVPTIVPKKKENKVTIEEGKENENENETETEKEREEGTKKSAQEKEEEIWDSNHDVYVEKTEKVEEEAVERDWEEERDISPLERISERINQPGAEKDQDLIDLIHTTLKYE